MFVSPGRLVTIAVLLVSTVITLSSSSSSVRFEPAIDLIFNSKNKESVKDG